MALAVLMRKLKKAVSEEDRLAIYRFLKGNKNLSPVLYNQKTIQPLTTFLLRDVSSDKNVSLQTEALCVLEIVLSHDHITESLNSNISQEIITNLITQIKETDNADVCAELISCLTVLVCNISPNILTTELPQLLNSLEKWLQNSSQDVIISKICHLFQGLITESADIMIPHISIWSKWILFPLCHKNNEVRKLAMKNLELCIPIFLMTEKIVLPIVVTEVKLNIIKEMNILYPVDKLYVLKLWGNIITILGKVLHKGSSFINSLLEIVEKAFKSDDEYVHAEALNAWQNLINNFSMDLEIMGNHKRLKLLLQPLKLNKITTENVAVTKCKTWWHLIWQLDSKLTANFEMVCIPLLQFAFSSHLKDVNSTNTPLSPATTRSGKKNDHLPLGPKTEQVQRLGYEILIRLLEQDKKGSTGVLNSPKTIPNISLLPLKSPLTNSVVIQHAQVLIYAVKVALRTFGHNINYTHFNCYVIKLLTIKILSLVEDKTKSSFDSVIQYFQLISDSITNKYFTSSQNLKLLDDILLFPKEILTSYQCNIEYGNKNYNIPLKMFLSIMLETDIESLQPSDKYLMVISRFLSYIQNVAFPLKFFTSVMETLEVFSVSFSSPEVLYKIWSQICIELLELIQKTQEVNEGTNSSCNFTCFPMVFSYPVQHFLTCNLLQAGEKQLWKHWCDLYKAFARCAALVPSAEANISCELVCKKMKDIPEEQLLGFHVLTIMCQLIETIIDCVDYTSLGRQFSVFMNWEEQKEKPLHNLTSCILLLEKLLSVFPKIIQINEDIEKGKENKQLIACANNLLEIVKKLITRINCSSLLKILFCRIAPYLVPFFNFGRKEHTYEKIYSAQFFNTLESLWTNSLISLQLHYSGPYDTEFLLSICPLLEVAFFHMRPVIVDHSRQFWYLTFGCNINNLNLPLNFKNVIKKLKPSLIPDISPVEEISNSVSASEDSVEVLMPKLNNILSSSTPMKNLSSKVINNKQEKSILCNQSISPIKSKLEDIDDKHFVRIETPAKSKTVLTEHQKEIRKRRSYVPAMYNDLSQETADLESQSNFTEKFNDDVEFENCTKFLQEKNTNQNQQPIIIIESIETIPLSSETAETISSQSLEKINFNNSLEKGDSSLKNSHINEITSSQDTTLKNSEISEILNSQETTLKNSQINEISSSNDKLLSSIETDLKLHSSPVIILEDCSLKLKSKLKENILNLSSQTTIDETCEDNSEIQEITKFNKKLLVVDNEKFNEDLNPSKLGVMTLVKNNKRDSNLFPKLSQDNSKIDINSNNDDDDDDDAIPSSQDSINRSGVFSLNKSRNRIEDRLNNSLINSTISKQSICNDETLPIIESNVICSDNQSNTNNIKNSYNESKIEINASQHNSKSKSLLNEITEKPSNANEYFMSSEDVKILPNVVNSNVSNTVIDLVSDNERNSENSSVFYNSTETDNLTSLSSQSESSDSENSEKGKINELSMIESYSKNTAINIDDRHYSSNMNCSNENYDESLEVDRCLFYNSEAKRRRSQRKLMPTRRVVESLLPWENWTNNKVDCVNYKELLQCKGTFSPNSKKCRYNSVIDQANDILKTRKSSIICHLSNSDDSSSLVQELFPETKKEISNELLTKSLNDSGKTELTKSDFVNTELLNSSKDKNLLQENSIKYNYDKSSQFNSSNQEVSQDNVEDSLSSDINKYSQEIDDKMIVTEKLEEKRASLQEELEQTPELKKPLESVDSLSTSSKRNLRPKLDKAGKLKSIELEKLFLEKNDQNNTSEESSLEKNELNSERKDTLKTNTKSEKPKGAQKRKMKSSNLTSTIVSRLRTRSTLAKQRVMQKPRTRGRPKSRNGITYRHKPKRLSNVSIKTSKSPVRDDDKILTEGEDEKENNNCKDAETTKSIDISKETDLIKVDNDLLSQDKESEKSVSENETSKDEQMIKTILPDSSRKRSAMDARQYHKKPKTTVNLLISPLSRSQKILRAAIGNFSSQERGMPWKSSKAIISPIKSKLGASSQELSPEQSKCQSPRWVKHTYSPSASPSAGILKRKQLNDEYTSLSPPQKQRKVSFADPLVEYEVPVENCYVYKSTPTKSVSRCLEMTKGIKQALSSIQTAEIEKSSSDSSPQSSEEYQNTPLSLYDSEEKVFPALIGCTDPVDSILPFLTCSIWPRGLGQLVHARNICTIGDLCSLTVSEMLALPIKSPKLETVRKVLHNYYEKFHKDLENRIFKSATCVEIINSNTSDNLLNKSLSSESVCNVDQNELLDEENKLLNDQEGFIDEEKLLSDREELLEEEKLLKNQSDYNFTILQENNLLKDQEELLDDDEKFSDDHKDLLNEEEELNEENKFSDKQENPLNRVNNITGNQEKSLTQKTIPQNEKKELLDEKALLNSQELYNEESKLSESYENSLDETKLSTNDQEHLDEERRLLNVQENSVIEDNKSADSQEMSLNDENNLNYTQKKLLNEESMLHNFHKVPLNERNELHSTQEESINIESIVHMNKDSLNEKNKLPILEENTEYEINKLSVSKISNAVSQSSLLTEIDLDKNVEIKSNKNSQFECRVDDCIPMECCKDNDKYKVDNLSDNCREEINKSSVNIASDAIMNKFNSSDVSHKILCNDNSLEIDKMNNSVSVDYDENSITDKMNNANSVIYESDKIDCILEEGIMSDSAMIRTTNECVSIENEDKILDEIYPLINDIINSILNSENIYEIKMNQLNSNETQISISANNREKVFSAQEVKEMCISIDSEIKKESETVLEKLFTEVENKYLNTTTTIITAASTKLSGNDTKEQVSNNNSGFNILNEETVISETDKEALKEDKMDYEDCNDITSNKTFSKPHCGFLIEENETLSSEEDNTVICINETEIDATEAKQSFVDQQHPDIEMLRSSFTIENLKKFPLLHLVGMLEKLTTAIRHKTEENESSNATQSNNLYS